MEILLSKSSMPVISWIAWLLGWLMNGIYEVINFIGIPNLALAIVIYTIIVYMLMTPIQVRQQKSSKMMAIVQPEIQKIQRKYQGKRDQASQMKMQEEMQSIYRVYGVSPMGSCLPLLIQLPLLFALYQVIYCIPGYIAKIADIFSNLAGQLVNMGQTAVDALVNGGITATGLTTAQSAGSFTLTSATDFLYALKPSQWETFKNISEFSGIKDSIVATQEKSQAVGQIFGINITLSPWDAITSGAIGLVIVGILVIFLAWFTQWLNAKLMPQQMSGGVNAADTTSNSMRSMNMIMPIFSAFICATLSIGIGVYWITGAVIRCIQQVVLNRRMMHIDAEEMIRRAKEKNEKKAEKRRVKKKEVTNEALKKQAHTNVKKINTAAIGSAGSKNDDYEPEYLKKAKGAREDSITARANMVRKFEEESASKKKKK